MSKRTADFLLLIVGILWGGGFIATDAALRTFPPFAMLVLRFCGAAVLGWIPVMAARSKIKKSAVKTGILSGIFLYLAFAFQTFGLQLTETGMNAFLTAVNVVLVPYLSWIVLKQRPNRKIILASLICLAGIGFLSLSTGSFRFRFGDLLTLICAVFFAAQIVVLGRAEHENPWVINAVQLSAAAVFSIPFGMTPDWPQVVSPTAVFSVLYSIVLSTFVCYLLQTLAQKYTTPAAASLLLCTESLWANVFGWLILHEAKTPIMILGGLLIFASVLIVEMPAGPGRNNTDDEPALQLLEDECEIE